jgi:NAD(P)-dependent dehydrogenase (short-subunit alcohol dehydrogenase family)
MPLRSYTLIDWQMKNVTPLNQDAGEAIEAEFEASGLMVVPRMWRGDPPNVMPIAYSEIVSRRKFGGPGDPTAALRVIANLWPVVAVGAASVAGGVAGAAGKDVYEQTKAGIKKLLRGLLAKDVGSVAITVVGPEPEPTYEFQEEDLGNIDRAVDAMPAHWETSEVTTTQRRYRWNPETAAWEVWEW